MSTTGHETEAINVRGLKASLKKGGNIGIFNECICSTAGGTAAKVTNTVPPSFSLVSGAKIIVKFTYAITVANATLQVGETAAKPIRIMGSALDANIIKAGTSVLLSYDGTAYNIIGGVGGNDVDVNYDTTNKKITKTIDDVTSDVVTAATIVEDGGGIEVEIGETAPTGTPKLFVDEDADPAGAINIYNKTQVDTLLDGKVSNPIELASLSADYTFKKGDTIIVGTGLYKCNVTTTTTPPFDFVFDVNGSVVIDTINGYEAVVVDSDILNTGWEKVMEVSDRHYTETRLSTKADKATTASGYGIIDVYTKNQIDALTRHTRLTDFDLNVLKQAVADQNLEKYGLKVGDQKTINGHTYVIAGLNPMKGTTANYRVQVNHVGLIVIPHTTQAWNVSGNTYTGSDGRGAGYANCDLHYYLVNTLLPQVETDLGADNLIGHRKFLSNSVDANAVNKSGGASVGASNNWTWSAGCKICALSEVQVYGAAICSSSFYDTGEACCQLEVFQKYSHTEIFGGEYPWLRDVVSASHAAVADNDGGANNSTASHADYVAALILFH